MAPAPAAREEEDFQERGKERFCFYEESRGKGHALLGCLLKDAVLLAHCSSMLAKLGFACCSLLICSACTAASPCGTRFPSARKPNFRVEVGPSQPG